MSLNCPNCGAGAGADATCCEYCGSRLATVACPSCLGSMFVGAQFCPHCGAKAAVTEEAGGQQLPCPGCGAAMYSVLVGNTAMHECDKCGSSWLTRDVFQALCIDRQQQGVIATAVGPSTSAAKPPPPHDVRYVKCPVCGKIMNRVNFGRRSGIVVDVCKPHGVWFERDELRGVLNFIASGGLEHVGEADDTPAVARLKALNVYDGLGSKTTDADRGAEAVLRIAQAHEEHQSPLAMILDTLFR